MKIKQAAAMLNTIISEVTGESAVIAEDMSNIVDVGRQLTASDTFESNFDNFVGKIIDKIGRTKIVDRTYRRTAPDIMRDSWEYGSILEKVRVEVGDYLDNLAWSIKDTQTFEDLFGAELPTVTAKYFNSKVTFSMKISVGKPQLVEAFQSATEMMKFISSIENRVNFKMSLAVDKLTYMCLCNLIAEKIKANKNVVNLLKIYNTKTGETLTSGKALTDRKFLAFCSATIRNYRNYLTGASMLYNDDGYTTFTPEENQRLVMLSDFATALDTVLLAETFNEEFVKIGNYTTVPYWQGTGTTNEERSKISVIPASEGEKPADGSDTRRTITQSGIMAVIFDEEAAAICCENPVVEAQRNAQKRITNFFHSFDANYLNDTGENCVVFVIADN